jgi:hypothetical protein
MGVIPHGSEDYRKRNPHLFREVETKEPEPVAQQALDSSLQKQESLPEGLVFRVILRAHVRRLLDDDNLVGGLKVLRDSISRTLGIDDGDSRIKFEYEQQRTKGEEGVAVTIQFL